MAFLRLAVRGDDERAVGRGFSGAVVETSLASYPGTFFTSAPGNAQAVARYWPTTIAAGDVTPRIECEGEPVAGSLRTSAPGAPTRPPAVAPESAPESAPGRPTAVPHNRNHHRRDLVTVPLWVLIGGRSGDKGGDANVGLWADTESVADWLCDSFGVDEFKEALPEAAPFEVSRYPLPNLRAVNFVVHGILGWGVASNLRLDTQAKGMAERLRSHPVRGALASRGQRPAGAASGLDTDLTKGCQLPTRRDGQRATATGVNSQRRCLIPLIKVERNRSGSPQAAMSGRRSNS